MRQKVRGLILFLAFFACASSFAITAGKFSYTGAPEDYNGDTMKVNDTMVAMSNQVFVKSQTLIDSIPDTPCVFFVIDNSPSMSFANGGLPLSDTNGYRYKVANAMIDTLYKHYPSAQVGFAVFDSALDFSTTLDPTVMSALPAPNQNMGAYMKLLTLNGSYEGTTGLALAHKYLHDSLITLPSSVKTQFATTVNQAWDLVYNQHRWRGSTNIDVGFAAAKNAMLLATHPKQDQYVVFQSDGASNCCGSTVWGFVTPGDSMPTTFTVYYNRDSIAAVPDIDSMTKMTTNIRNDGYSVNNPRSNLWPFLVSTYSSLLNFLMNNVYSAIATSSLAGPSSITIGTQTATSWIDSSFSFGTLFPLTGPVTPFTYNINYQLAVNGTVLKDTTHIVNFDVARTAGVSMDTTKFQIQRWDRALAFRYNGAPVSAITDQMDSVELRFGYSPGTANYGYSSVQVQLATRSGAQTDSEFYTLSRVGTTDTFSVKFKDTTVVPPVKGDGVLEHTSPVDTIVAIFRNHETPPLPMDTLRLSCPVFVSPGRIFLSVVNDTIHAGDTAALSGWVATARGDTLSWLDDSIKWAETPPVDGGDALIGAVGGSTRFTATQAFDSTGNNRVISLVASVVNPYNTALTVKATAHIVVVPRLSGYRIDVERIADTALFKNDLTGGRSNFYWSSAPLSTIVMDSVTDALYAYAVVRDPFGNYIRISDSTTTWTALDPDTVGALAENARDVVHLGYLTRMNAIHTGTGSVVIDEPGLPPDTVVVQLHTDRLLAIGLFNGATATPVDTVSLNTDQAINLVVEGEWVSAPSSWVPITGMWSLKPNPDTLQFVVAVPSLLAGNWSCNPLTPGHALLTVTSSGQSVTIPMIIIQSGVDSVKLVLVTNPDSCFAGRPIKIAATIGNVHGPLPGTTVQSCVYHDYLSNTPRPDFMPWLTVNGGKIPDSLDKPLQESFLNGTDTVSLVLYYAPDTTDSLHRMQLTLNSVLQATTVPFRLRPWIIDSLQIEDTNGVHLVDTLVLSQTNPGDSLRARGFDRYGNAIALDSGDGTALTTTIWSVDGALPQPAVTTGADIYYAASPARAVETGNVWATLVTDSATLRTSVPVKVLPSLPMLMSAITRDRIGGTFDSSDGLIDEIDCYFSKPVVIPNADYAYFSAVHGTDTLKITGILQLSDSSYALQIHDSLTNLSVPQTSWRPTVSVANLPVAVNASVQAADGCAPVVWQVIKHANGPNHQNDVVEVQFSENIFNRSGGQFTTANQPYQTFSAYTLTASGYVPIDSLFNGIVAFQSNQPDSVLYFTMSNGADLTDTNYIDIRAPNPLIQDQYGNVPPQDNHRCRVAIAGNAIGLTVFPNPTKGTFKHPTQSGNNGDIDLFDQPQAQQWVEQDNAGFVLLLQGVKWPQTGTGYIRANMEIYDIVGNLVNSAQTDNLFKNSQQGNSGSADVTIYWNGANHKGMLVAPGIYRAVVYINYPANSLNYKNARLVKSLGVK